MELDLPPQVASRLLTANGDARSMASSSWDLRPCWPKALAANQVVSPTAGERREPKTRSSPMAQAMAALAALVEPRARARARRERKDFSSNSSRCSGCNSQSSREKA